LYSEHRVAGGGREPNFKSVRRKKAARQRHFLGEVPLWGKGRP